MWFSFPGGFYIMIMAGWIRLYRDIQGHWIWENPVYLKAWINILLSVNFEDKKVLIEGELIECKRGQSVYSLNSWSRCLGKGWTIQRVRTFFELLKQDQMITTEGLRKTTRLTVCNYDIYQNDQQTDNMQTTCRQHADNKEITTTKEGKERKELKNDKDIFDFANSLFQLGVQKDIVDDWLKVRKNKKASNTETAFKSIKSQITISGISANECIKTAVEHSWSGFKADWIKSINKTEELIPKFSSGPGR